MKTVKSPITTGWVNVNTCCQNRCVWCYRQADFEEETLIMPEDHALQIIDFYADLDIITLILIGGEPLLYKNLINLIKRAKKNGIKEATVVTNGRLLKRAGLVSDLLIAGLDLFSVSIHSASSDVHDRITKKDHSWDETVEGIKNVVNKGARCSLNVIVGEENYESVPDSLPKMLSWGIEQIIVSCANPCLRNGAIDGEYALNPRKFSELVERIKDISPKVIILNELPLCILKRETFLHLIEEKRLGYGCHVGSGRGLSIDATGNIIPCNSFTNTEIVNVIDRHGKLKYTPDEFLKIWQEDVSMKEMRDMVNVYRSEKCLKCNLWEICNCGCPLMWGYYDPDNIITENLYGLDLTDLTVINKERRKDGKESD